MAPAAVPAETPEPAPVRADGPDEARSAPPVPEGPALALSLLTGAVRGMTGQDLSPRDYGTELPRLIARMREVPLDKALSETVSRIAMRLGPSASQAPTISSLGMSDEDLFAEMINGCFRALLGRDCGAEGIAYWKNERFQDFLVQGPDEFLLKFMPMIIGSNEWYQRHVATAMDAVRAQMLHPHYGGAHSPQVLSLGSTGYTSSMLRRFGMRRWSGPFDWLSATPEMVTDILSEDFAPLLDPDGWETINPADRPNPAWYQSRNRKLEKRHGAPCILHSADMSTEAGQQYMARCVQRFQDAMRGVGNKLLLQVIEEDGEAERHFQEMSVLLNAIGRHFNFVLISVVKEQPEAPFPQIEPVLAAGPHRLLRFQPISRIQAASSADMLDELVLLRATLAAIQMPVT
ncbi:hypothetical protein EOD42_23830 [Rhodovarius crocodyli]|uniref:Uncharacterized protein n=1 Tax=Rhodovarius crocodyli TaxID=1979269 RepID=A0A437LXI8_9PROT|nr:DUF1796 family putative cysteine peptidase [Rhodovarius crocodyli]RVT90064.1 hypothetical protein EOD42_23830 [Rhodovarius crocodyli]